MSSSLISSASSEQRYWSEHVLIKHCMLSNRLTKQTNEEDRGPLPVDATLKPFRAWASFWTINQNREVRAPGKPTKLTVISPRSVWQIYYETLSALLQQGATYSAIHQGPSASGRDHPNGDAGSTENSKLQQMIELKRIENLYEDILLKEIKFPKASEANPEVERWADQVMANWRLTFGPSWRDEDLGGGGKESTTRSVLAVSYSILPGPIKLSLLRN